MRILITGNMGYVGPVLTAHLAQTWPQAELVGYDIGYFAHCLTGCAKLPEIALRRQVFGDIREFSPDLLEGVDAVVHLAAVSNDPMGDRFAGVTAEVNHGASVALARAAAAAGVARFVFASSCSMYGQAMGGPRREGDELNPLTAYARSKAATERDLEAMAGPMRITALRFATACGYSPRLRLDLVLNDFVACALASRRISVLSDGTPWRPLIHVRDMALAIEWALRRDESDGGMFVSVNAGSDAWNVQVRDLALAVAQAIPGTEVNINTAAPTDKRSYRVDFSRFAKLAPDHQPQVRLEEAIDDLRAGLEAMRFSNAEFRDSDFMRLKVLQGHIEAGRVDTALRWRRGR